MTNYGMFTDEGNGKVETIVFMARNLHETLGYPVEGAWNWAQNELAAADSYAPTCFIGYPEIWAERFPVAHLRYKSKYRSPADLFGLQLHPCRAASSCTRVRYVYSLACAARSQSLRFLVVQMRHRGPTYFAR